MSDTEPDHTAADKSIVRNKGMRDRQEQQRTMVVKVVSHASETIEHLHIERVPTLIEMTLQKSEIKHLRQPSV